MDKLKFEKSLAYKKPEIAKQWFYERNGDITPEDVFASSDKVFWWICINNPDHLYQKSVSQRKDPRKGCPKCTWRIAPYEKSLSFNNPKLAKEWNIKKNAPLKADEVYAQSNLFFWWICDEGHEWEAAINNRNSKKGRGCPDCRKQMNFANGQTLSEYAPELLDEWAYGKNEADPTQIPASSDQKVWWKCENGHEWQYQVRHRAKSKSDGSAKGKCSKCQSLGFLYPEISKLWNPLKNGKLTPFDVKPRSSKIVWWRCSYNHEYERSLSNQFISGGSCPVCNSATSFPEQAIYYYLQQVFTDVKNRHRFSFKNTNNVGIETDIYIPRLMLAIEYDGAFYHDGMEEREQFKNQQLKEHAIKLIRIKERISNIERTGDYHLITRDGVREDESLQEVIEKLLSTIAESGNLTEKELKKLSELTVDIKRDRIGIFSQFIYSDKEGNLTKTHPELVKDWDYEQNNGLRPEQFTFGSGKEVAWCCSTCSHKWIKRIADRAVDGVKCPICETGLRSKRVSKHYLIQNGSLADNHPKLLQWWDYEKNTDVLPEEVTSKKRLNVWWKCEKDHSYIQRIDHKVAGSGCIVCAEEKRKQTRKRNLLTNGKSLAVRYPELSIQWHPIKNGDLTPNHISGRSGQTVWWQCENNHEWEQSPHGRSSTRTKKCPECIKDTNSTSEKF